MIIMATEMELDDYQGMTDYQKLQMTQISYLDFENMEQIKGKKVSELDSYLSNPNLWGTRCTV